MTPSLLLHFARFKFLQMDKVAALIFSNEIAVSNCEIKRRVEKMAGQFDASTAGSFDVLSLSKNEHG